MKHSHLLFALFLSVSVMPYTHTEQEESQFIPEQESLSLQAALLSAAYEVIGIQYQSDEFQCHKNDLGQALGEYFDIYLKKETSNAELILAREKIKECIENLLGYFRTHITEQNSLDEIGSPKNATVIVYSIYAIETAKHYMGTEENAQAIQNIFQDLTEIIQSYLS